MGTSRSSLDWDTHREHVALRHCDVTGCLCDGEFRAPKSRDQLNDYFWFCLEHVREYNRAWDYYAGMKPDEIEAHMRADTTWNRPTWPLGKRGATLRRGERETYFTDPFEFFGEEAGPHPNTAGTKHKRRPHGPEEHALVVFDLEAPITAEQVKSRYKELVKRHHPDANGGDKDAEERLKLINEAYQTLRQSLAT
jgi:DnaJ-domain-containing protein 1